MKLTHYGFAILMAVSQLALTSCDSKKEESGGGSGGTDPGGKAQSGSSGYVLAEKDYLYPAGTKVEVIQNNTIVDAAMTVLAGGQEMTGTMSMKKDELLLAEMVSATEAKAEVKMDREENTIDLPGVPAGEGPKISSAEGKTITFNLENGTWVAGLASGEELNEELQEKADNITKQMLTREANVEMYGTKARKVGDEWEVDAAAMPSLADTDGEVSGTITLKFTGVEDHAGYECAVLTGTLDVAVKPGEESAEKMNVQMTGEMKIYRSLKYLTDLEVTLQGVMEVNGTPQQGVSVKTKGPMKMMSTVKLTLP